MQLIHQISLRYLEKRRRRSRRRRRIIIKIIRRNTIRSFPRKGKTLIIIIIIRRKTIRYFPLKGKDLNKYGKMIFFFVGKISLWQILISLRHIWSPCLTPSIFFFFFFLHFLNFLRNGSSQPNKPYIHFVALEKTHLLSHKSCNYLTRYESESRKTATWVRCLQFIHLFKTWVRVLSVWQYMFLIKLDKTNRLSLVWSFYLKPF